MYPISSSVAALFEAENAQVLRITGTDRNGTSIHITEENIILGSFNIDRYCCNGDKLEVGTAIAAEMTLKLNNADGTYDNVVFEGTELFVEIGVADWSLDNPVVSYIPIGYFTPDVQPRKQTTISLKALDRMTRLDVVPPILTPWTDNNGNVMTNNSGTTIEFLRLLVFPCTVAQLVSRICAHCDLATISNLQFLPNASYPISGLPTLQQDITYRQIIQWCAGIMGTCAFIDWAGRLNFKWYSNADYTSTPDRRYKSDLHENSVKITGIQYTNTQNVTIVAGDPEYTIDMTGNYLAASGIATIIQTLETLSGFMFTYRPFEATVVSAPWLWPMDVITFVDNDGNSHICAVTNVNFGLNGATSIAGKGESAQANKGISHGGVTNEQAFLIERAVEYASEMSFDDVTQEQIFNKLTNDGEIQGLILYEGKVYLNASYVKSGVLSADFIKGGTLTLGGSGNINGALTVKDASGNVVGTWDKDGISVSAGTIAGGTITGGTINGANLTLGGNNNASGTLTVKNANGTTIGSWSKDGLSVSSGSITGGTINGASLTLGGNNNASGTLIVKDSNGTTVGTLNKDGISVAQGSITGGTINGASLTLGGNNNASGTLTVKDAYGDTVGTWDKDGIFVSDGTIAGGTITGGEINGASLTLGGNNNTSGTLTVKDANNNTVGTWNNNGITINKGSIANPSSSNYWNLTDGTFKAQSATIGPFSVDASKFTLGNSSVGNYLVKLGSVSLDNTNQVYGIAFQHNESTIRQDVVFLDAINQSLTFGQIAYGTFRSHASIRYVYSGSEYLVFNMREYTGSGSINADVLDISLSRITIHPETINLNATDGDISMSVPNGQSIILNDRTEIWGDLHVYGEKYRSVATKDYGKRLLACYETPTPMFGDVGEGVIGEDGFCYVTIDPIFVQTINTTQYQVFLQNYGRGEAWVKERKGAYFIVEGTPGLSFGWEIKGKQKDYDQQRLKRNDKPFIIPKQTYGEDAAQHIENIQKERIAA